MGVQVAFKFEVQTSDRNKTQRDLHFTHELAPGAAILGLTSELNGFKHSMAKMRTL
jgi:hypothetical protein